MAYENRDVSMSPRMVNPTVHVMLGPPNISGMDEDTNYRSSARASGLGRIAMAGPSCPGGGADRSSTSATTCSLFKANR